MDNLNLLRNEPAFHKLFLLCKKKYESLGRIGGSVSLKTFTEPEIITLSGLTGIAPDQLMTKQTLTLTTLENALAETKFEYDSLRSFLEAYFGETLISKKEREKIEQADELVFSMQMKKQFPIISWYIDWLIGKTADTRWIWSLYKGNHESVSAKLSLLESAYNTLAEGKSYVRLPLFAQKITGNPHAFDRNEELGKWLLHLLTVDQLRKGTEITFNKTTEEENELLGQYKLLRDDLWSFVTCRGLIAERNGEIHPVWSAAIETNSVLNLPLKEMINIDTAYPHSSNTVWVAENSSVASTLMDAAPHAAIICTHGQLRLAGWRLLELLATRDIEIHYSGDIDPEGLLIADRVLERFKNRVKLWRMDDVTYEDGISGDVMSEIRLSKLDKLRHPKLQQIATLMRKHKKPTYQEAVIERLVEDLK
ncbi:TIGR02679 family protein [Alkalihalophilus pseudofirmus]|uniref:TIGR02679 family protein n=1 Tax=Alkalihalophilus pseudofirmus TaxID=79885 RepID=UPI00158C8C89